MAVPVAGLVVLSTATTYFTREDEASFVVQAIVADILPAVTLGPEERVGAEVSAVVVNLWRLVVVKLASATLGFFKRLPAASADKIW